MSEHGLYESVNDQDFRVSQDPHQQHVSGISVRDSGLEYARLNPPDENGVATITFDKRVTRVTLAEETEELISFRIELKK